MDLNNTYLRNERDLPELKLLIGTRLGRHCERIRHLCELEWSRNQVWILSPDLNRPAA